MVACHCVCSHHMLALCVCMRGRHYEKESVPVFERVCACCVWLMMVHGESCIVCVLEGLPIVCVRQSVCFSMCLCVAFVFVRICDGLWGILYCACASWCVCVCGLKNVCCDGLWRMLYCVFRIVLCVDNCGFFDHGSSFQPMQQWQSTLSSRICSRSHLYSNKIDDSFLNQPNY